MLGHWEQLYAGKGYYEVEFRLVTKSGQIKWCSSTWGPILDEQGRQVGVQGRERDITQRKNLEREIAAISKEEQQRLAHELHDHLGAYMAGIAFRIKALAENLDRLALPEASAAKELVKLVNAGTDQVRNFARLLAPIEVGSDGLTGSLSRLGAEMESLFGIVCRVEVAPGLPALTSDQGLQLYRIAQEAARNGIQHAKARRVEISVRHESGQLIQTVRNDGNAWDPTKESAKSLGLRIMRYRAGTLGGTLSLQSEADGHSSVICQFPLPLPGQAGPMSGDPAPAL
jgi:signal transduction histidine kinase